MLITSFNTMSIVTSLWSPSVSLLPNVLTFGCHGAGFLIIVVTPEIITLALVTPFAFESPKQHYGVSSQMTG